MFQKLLPGNGGQAIDRQLHTIPNQRPKDSQLYTFPPMPTITKSPHSYSYPT